MSGEIVRFKGYGVNSVPLNIIVSRIVSFNEYPSNSNVVTEIHLDNGDSVLVGEYESTVRKSIQKALDNDQ